MKSWEYTDKYIFSGVDLNTNPHTFNNLEGDKYDYRIYAVVDNLAAQAFQMFFNADTGANYRNYEMSGTNVTAAATVADADSIIDILTCDTIANYRHLAEITILGDSSNERMVDIFASGHSTNPYVYKRSSFWKNTADELTSLSFNMSTTTVATGEIYLFRRQKESIYNAADWELIEEYEWSSVNLNTSPKIFNNLQGDKDIEYMLEAEMTTATLSNHLIVYPNGDTTTANYTLQQLFNNGGTLTSSFSNERMFLILHPSSTGSSGNMILKAESGQQRSSIISSGSALGTVEQNTQANWWSNTADEITSLEIQSLQSAVSSGKIKLYKRSKNRSTPSHERLIYDYDISGDFSSGQEFKNLDTNKMYRIEGELISSATSDTDILSIRYNGDTGSNYTDQTLAGAASSASAGSGNTTSASVSWLANNSIPANGNVLLFPKTGKYRPSIQTRTGTLNAGSTQIALIAYWWLNTADDLQDLIIYNATSNSVTGNIKIWEINL